MISNEQTQRLRELNTRFLEENAKINLSAFRTEEASWIGNVMDSLSFLDLAQCKVQGSRFKVLDIGTGGGFPLLPLAICLPDATCTGIDATQKKIDAIQRIIDHLGIKNVTLLCGRTEELGRNAEHREQYDVVTARAVAPLHILLEYASPFVKPGGYIVAWKSLKIQQELEESLLARAELSCQLVEQYEYDLDEDLPASHSPERSEGGGWGKRQLLIFQKRAKLHEKYPRAIGIPKKNPLV